MTKRQHTMSKMIDSQNWTGPKPTTTTFDTTLRELRRAKKLTKTELARMLTQTHHSMSSTSATLKMDIRSSRPARRWRRTRSR